MDKPMTKKQVIDALFVRLKNKGFEVLKKDLSKFASDRELFGWHKGLTGSPFGRRRINEGQIYRTIKKRKGEKKGIQLFLF